jgi:O-antigen/teichoic acid export membrane protein
MAYRFLRLPVDATSQILGRVLLSAFSRMQDDDARLKSAYLRSNGAIAFLTFPMMLGLLVVARPFIEVVLGVKWLPAVPLLSILAPLGMVQSIEVTVPYIFLSKGRADWLFRWSVATGTLSIFGILAGLRWGVVGVAVSYSLTMTLLMVLGCWIAFKLVEGLRIRDLFKAVWPNLTCTGAMALVVLGCRIGMEYAEIRSVIVLPVCVAVGILSYGLIVLCLQPPALDLFLRILPDRWTVLLRRFIPSHDGISP